MSFIGIDIGSSSVKICAYDETGHSLKSASSEIHALHPFPGAWETDVEDVWRAVKNCFHELAASSVLKADPPAALAVSASGRENFPLGLDGRALANNLMGADMRGAEFEVPPPGVELPEAWSLACGHLRERMDPLLRYKWWHINRPEIIEQAVAYPDWHGFLTLRLCGRNVSEPSLTARWAAWDLPANTWSFQQLNEWQFPERLLPEVLQAGQPVGYILSEVADELGLPTECLVVTGGHDMNCHGIGAGVENLGAACLISGSYENILIPTDRFATPSMLLRGLSVVPHFGNIPRTLYAICPTGNAVMNWVRNTLGVSVRVLNEQLETRKDPSPVMALPYLSGAMLYWEEGRSLKGGVLGLTLATSPLDIAQAFLEAIVYDHVNTLALLDEEDINVHLIRATGGGARSSWWTQLKSDLLGIPIEVSVAEEPATLGAAILAATGSGFFSSVEDGIRSWTSGTSTIYQPDPSRAALHFSRLEHYRRVVPVLRDIVFENFSV